MDNLSLSRQRIGQACTLVRVRQVGEDRDCGHCFERFCLGPERDASNLSLSGEERLLGRRWREVREYGLRPSVGVDGAEVLVRIVTTTASKIGVKGQLCC